MKWSALSFRAFFLFFLLLPTQGLTQGTWVPDRLERRFHPEEGVPWFMKDHRPDSIDVLHYRVRLDKPDRDAGTLSGNCRIRFRTLTEGVDRFRLDLAGFDVEKVLMEGQEIEFSRDKEEQSLLLRFPKALNKGDSAAVRIAYEGEPVVDETGWGGTYFRKGYVFNLGVGFGARPHSYARTWFPCVDHFRERASYSFRMVAPEGEKAVCSGILREKVEVEGGKEWHWELDQQVPPYLVSFAVGEFSTVRRNYQSRSGGKVPIRIDVPPEKKEQVKGSFVHLEEALRYYEKCFGPYRWPRVGYVAIPFPSGAMEHATNIAYPRASVNGTPNSDDLLVHELSHNWWGNLVTCATPWDMWINEGMASFSELLFREKVPGDLVDKNAEDRGAKAYRRAVKENHRYVLRRAHLRDGEHLAVYGIPHEHTYGAHVYRKGADLVRTFRSMMGDSLFFDAMRRTLDEHAFSNMPTHRLGSLWQEYSGQPVERYFEDWLMKPGHPHFEVDSMAVEELAEGYRVDLELRQRLTHASEPFKFVPLELYFRGEDEGRLDTVRISSERERYTLRLPFEPQLVSADPGGKLAQALLTDTAHIQGAGPHSFEHVGAELKGVDRASYVELRQHFIAPEVGKALKEDLRVSKTRYWSAKGSFPQDSSVSVSFSIEGKQAQEIHPESSFFEQMKDIEEKELLILHRPLHEEKWRRCSTFRIDPKKDPADGEASFIIEGGLQGDFALAYPKP